MSIPGYISQVIPFAVTADNTVWPTGYLPCDGRLLPVQKYQALFSLIANMYGGDAMTTFGLPKLDPPFPAGTGVYLICCEGQYPFEY
jgi:microcystin-dependent protein